MPEVIFVAGAARSGSTLLASMLGHLPAALNVGELYFLWDRGLIESWRCGCGDPVPDCVLWSKVIATVDGDLDPEEMTRIRDRQVKTRHVPRLLRGGRPSVDLLRFARTLEETMVAAAELSGADVIIDTSKSPAAALLLHLHTSLNVRVIHLVRDPRASAFSQSRPKLDPATGAHMPASGPVPSTFNWLNKNWLIDSTVAPRLPTLRIRYEDLVTAPGDVLRQISDHIGQDLPDDLADRPWSPQHTVSGNPARFSDLPIVADTTWEQAMPRRDRLLAAALSWPLRRRYGYRTHLQLAARAPRRHEAIHELDPDHKRRHASRLRFVLARRLQSQHRVYPLFARVMPARSPLLVRQDTELAIEGAPRSANTFLVAVFELLNPQRRTAHHLHNPCQVLRAARFGVPCIVVVRDPMDAAASALVWSSDRRPREVVQDWVTFYERALPYADSFVVADFELATTAPGKVLTATNHRFGTCFATDHEPERHDPLVMESVERLGREHDGDLYETRVARPSSSEYRQQQQRLARRALDEEVPASLRSRASELYETYFGLAARSLVAEDQPAR
jgi:hypothetical protein